MRRRAACAGNRTAHFRTSHPGRYCRLVPVNVESDFLRFVWQDADAHDLDRVRKPKAIDMLKLMYYAREPLRQKDIIEQLVVSKQRVSEWVRDTAEKGYIDRATLTLMPKGAGLCRESVPAATGV